MGRKLKPIFSKYEACTQTNLASMVYDGQPGDPVELHHVVYPAVKQVGGKSKGRKAQSAHGPAPYKKSGAYSKFKVKSQKLKPSEVNGVIDRFGRFLDKKKKKLTQARNKIVSQEDSQVPGQKVGLLVDEKSLYVDVVEVVGGIMIHTSNTIRIPRRIAYLRYCQFSSFERSFFKGVLNRKTENISEYTVKCLRN